MQDTPCQPTSRFITVRLGVPLVMAWTLSLSAFASESPAPSAEHIAKEAKSVWESGAVVSALEIIEQGIDAHPQALVLHKLRGDILTTFRDPQEAIRAYDTVLAGQPAALDVRWAKWSVFVRWGQAEEAIAELQRIARFDAGNPLVHLRLAQDLRKLDRLEESLESYKQAVALAPDFLSWRLALARARFDVLDYQGADADVQYVLQQVKPGSPLELPARNQLAQLYESMERGRRFKPVLTPDASESQLREWAAIRADAWRLFASGQYREAEPIYRRMLSLNPTDPLATHQLGVTLMELGRCEDALAVFGNMANLDPSEEDYADTTFRMGQCLVELERWEEAFVHFQILYDAALEFEESTKDVALPTDMRMLAKEKIARWLNKVRPHVPELEKMREEEAKADKALEGQSAKLSEEERYAQAVQRVKSQKTLETAAALTGRDADFSWFRFVIPAAKIVRDDFPTGAHEFIPLNPGDTFVAAQAEIYLVFGLVSASFDAVPLTARCVLETSEMTEAHAFMAQDRVMTAMNDQSGYFLLSPPKTGWPPGLYRCGLFAGERASAYTTVDEVRFRIIEPGG